MKITITLTDHESGNVKIETEPDVQQIQRMARDNREKITPALAYAMNALSVILKASLEQSRAERKIAIPPGILRPKFISPRR